MNSSEPDWSLWRSFAAVIEHGSLSAAARALELSQPTLGRHIEALESSLGTTLFERTLSGFKPTAAALRIYAPVEAARNAFAQATMIAEGGQAEINGTVRITASAIVSHYVLPTLLVPIRARYPDIAIEIVPTDSAENLLLREADIAIRMFRPTQLELITRRLGEIPILPTAHRDYLECRGTPKSYADLPEHDLIGFDRSDLIITTARSFGVTLGRDDFCLRTDSQTLGWELIRAGLGIGFAQSFLIRNTPGMVALDLGETIQPLEIWLTTHKELFTSQRIRAIYDALAEAMMVYIEASRV